MTAPHPEPSETVRESSTATDVGDKTTNGQQQEPEPSRDATVCVFSVEVHDYDRCSHLGYFSTREGAEAYLDSYNDFANKDQFGERAVIVECELDRPRAELSGAWYVVLAPDGSVWSAHAGPDVFTPSYGSRWVGAGYDDAPKHWGELRQGFGLTREDAARDAATIDAVRERGAEGGA